MRLERLVLEFGFLFSVLVVGCENDNGGIWCLCVFAQAKGMMPVVGDRMGWAVLGEWNGEYREQKWQLRVGCR